MENSTKAQPFDFVDVGFEGDLGFGVRRRTVGGVGEQLEKCDSMADWVVVYLRFPKLNLLSKRIGKGKSLRTNEENISRLL